MYFFDANHGMLEIYSIMIVWAGIHNSCVFCFELRIIWSWTVVVYMFMGNYFVLLI